MLCPSCLSLPIASTAECPLAYYCHGKLDLMTVSRCGVSIELAKAGRMGVPARMITITGQSQHFRQKVLQCVIESPLARIH